MGDFDFIDPPKRNAKKAAGKKASCSQSEPTIAQAGSALAGFGALLLGVAVVFGGCNGCLLRQGQSMMAEIAEDMERQYETVCRNGGSEMDRCMRAGAAAEAWLQADDEESYATWLRIRNTHAARAGLPMQ